MAVEAFLLAISKFQSVVERQPDMGGANLRRYRCGFGPCEEDDPVTLL